MKTKTGLTIVHKGARVEVYTDKELKRLDKENKVLTTVKKLLEN